MNRETQLESHAIAVGEAWAERVRLDLRRDAREPRGGWPGTLREARARTYAAFAKDALTQPELERVVRAVYEGARAHWLANARTDDEEQE